MEVPDSSRMGGLMGGGLGAGAVCAGVWAEAGAAPRELTSVLPSTSSPAVANMLRRVKGVGAKVRA